jgi:hypothetical protein
MLNKPQLYDWGSKMTALGAVTAGEDGTCPAYAYLDGKIDKDAYLQACLEARNVIGKDAAAGGTTLHKFVELGVQGVEQDEEGERVWRCVQAELELNWPGLLWKAELPAVHPLGFGCRTDLLGFDPLTGFPVVCVDLKTREFDHENVRYAKQGVARRQKDLGRLTPRETEPMQVAANLKAHNNDIEFFDGCGGNLYLSRNTADCVFAVKYTAEQMGKAWVCFQALNVVFKALKGLE